MCYSKWMVGEMRHVPVSPLGYMDIKYVYMTFSSIWTLSRGGIDYSTHFNFCQVCRSWPSRHFLTSSGSKVLTKGRLKGLKGLALELCLLFAILQRETKVCVSPQSEIHRELFETLVCVLSKVQCRCCFVHPYIHRESSHFRLSIIFLSHFGVAVIWSSLS